MRPKTSRHRRTTALTSSPVRDIRGVDLADTSLAVDDRLCFSGSLAVHIDGKNAGSFPRKQHGGRLAVPQPGAIDPAPVTTAAFLSKRRAIASPFYRSYAALGGRFAHSRSSVFRILP